eukprot:TRINITY_DN9616_c0_g1_i2.p1 TRINITY_DN9616_c0_g1~~TRINITY_DN9616_c0_g1_i2.p1  ORF type:complete len:723 (-),score=327.73 TRINITY_DN9616_c0_g1_i2:182-2350(-)
MRLVTLATCNLNQWALDFEGNLERISESIKQAKAKGATYRIGPELEVCGYSCEDHFLEQDTFLHCWEALAQLLKTDLTDGIICDIGLPVLHKNVRYNCRVLCLNRRILLIRPKLFLADDGNYREPRWFTGWQRRYEVEDFYLPRMIAEVTGQRKVPIGEAALSTRDTSLSVETCEELFTPQSPHINLGLDGIEIIGNSSGSHHQLKKLHKRVDLMHSASAKSGGVYLYANQKGCDGNRLYFDGCAMIFVNGDLVAQGSQFSLKDVEVVTATVDLEAVRSYRAATPSRGIQAAECKAVRRIEVDFELTTKDVLAVPSRTIEPRYLKVEEEIGYGPACWLWDYLRRSNQCGYFLPISGGADSSATCAIVGIMCQLAADEAQAGNPQVLKDVRRIVGRADSDYVPENGADLAEKIFYTCYMGTTNSSADTRKRAADLTSQIGSSHLSLSIDEIINSFFTVFQQVTTTKKPQFKVHGGTQQENLALQNIQARSRMVLSYFLSQLLLWNRGKPGSLLVLGSANVDEAIRGYFTKYDCSSADVNPIGGVSKTDLKKFLLWAAEAKGWTALTDVVLAPPTAELEPITETYTQLDEVDMGMTYSELERYGHLRKIDRCGPVSMFERLVHEWSHLTAEEVAEKVKKFFFYYSINRHKMTTLTPAYHAENYSPDDNRFDLRQFLYNAKWTWQFRKIDELVQQINAAKKGSRLPDDASTHGGQLPSAGPDPVK